MEGKYTKIGTIAGVIALLITLWQINTNNVSKLEGEWIMSSKVKEAKMNKYIGMNIEWTLHPIQNGNSLEGTGEKIKVNHEELSFSERTKIVIKGTVEGENFIMNYIEKGKQRQTSGIFQGKVDGKVFQGEFSQTASDSKGSIIGKKAKLKLN